MAVNRGQRAAPDPFGIGDVAVTDRAGADPDPDLARTRLGDADLLDRQRFPEGMADRGLHRVSPLSRPRAAIPDGTC